MPRIAMMLIIPLIAAGCLEPGGNVPSGDDGDAPPAEPAPIDFRRLTSGQHASIKEAAQRVIEDDGTWRSFWERLHQDQDPVPERPAVDFSTERVAAALLGQRPDGCYAVRITNATADGAQVTLTVTEYLPPPGMACIQVVTHPYDVIAIPLEPAEVAFQERQMTGPPSGAQ